MILGRGGGATAWGSLGGGGTIPAATISGVGAGILTAGDFDLSLLGVPRPGMLMLTFSWNQAFYNVLKNVEHLKR